MLALVDFATIAKVSVVKWIGKDKSNSVSVEPLAVPRMDAGLRQKGSDVFKTTSIFRIQLKRSTDE